MDLLPGIAQGMTRVLISYPFDILKVHIQTQGVSLNTVIKNIVGKDPRRLYRGVGIPLTVISFERGITYKYYEKLNKVFNPFLSGAITSVLSTIIGIPSQYITSNLALLDRSKYKGLLEYIRENYSRGCYKGSRIEFFRLYLGSTINLGVYGNLRNFGFQNPFLNGVITSMAVWTVIYPLDTIRTICQTNSSSSYRSIWDSYVMRPFSLWRGVGLMYFRSIPSAGFGMMIYEFVRSKIVS